MSEEVPRRIGCVLKMFPRLSETFILNEILELERQGLALRIVSLRRPAEAVSHEQTQRVRATLQYLPERIHREPRRILGAVSAVFRQHRQTSRQTLVQLLRECRRGFLLKSWRRFCQACCLIHETKDLCHLHAHYAKDASQVAFLVHRITGISYSITTHAKDVFQEGRLTSLRLRARMQQARFVVANSRHSADILSRNLGGELEVATVYNGLDLEAFPLRATQPAEPLILSVGRLVEKKGFAHLLEACRLLQQRGIPFRCEIVGTGELDPALRKRIRDGALEGQVRLLGSLPQQKLREHYKRARVFALPCVVAADGDRDVLPNVLKEAMAVGVPVITSRLDGIEELVEDGRTGLLVPPGDAGALAAMLERLLVDATLRQRLAAEARKIIAERFDRRTSFAPLKNLLLEAMQCPSSERSGALNKKTHRYATVS